MQYLGTTKCAQWCNTW